MNFELTPLSTFGIGSMPYVEGESACEEIFQNFDIPFWPQYPQRSLREKMIFQFLSSFPGLEVSQTNASFDKARYEKQIRAYRERLQQAFSKNDFLSFEPPEEWALGYAQMQAFLERAPLPKKKVIKLQVTGPATVWSSFFSNQVSAKYAQPVFDDLCLCLTASGLAQIQRFHLFGVHSMILIDEPIWGKNLDALQKMIFRFRKEDVFSGIHICSNPPWRDLEDLEMDFFHFDCSTFEKFNESQKLFLQSLLKKGSWIAWGIVPTTNNFELKISERAPMLTNWLNRFLGKSFSIEEIFDHSLLAPACGVGTLAPAAAQKVTQALLQTREGLKNLYFLS